MGQTAGRLKSVFRPVKNFDVEDRAFKVISKDKPTPAPTHAKMRRLMEDIKRDPELLSRGKMDPKTMENLSKVFIKSEGDNPTIKSARKLPLDRKGHEDYEYGYEEPKVIPKGKTSMRQVLEILNKCQEDPKVYTAEKIAQEYNIDLVDALNLLKYFKPFQVYMPSKQNALTESTPAHRFRDKMDQLKD